MTDPASLPGPAAVAESTTTQARRATVRVSAAAGGAVAATLGLGCMAAVVLLLWIASPYPDRGLDGALHVGAGLWLLAHGAELVRTQTLSGDPAPIALTPLLLSVLPAWLLHRAASSAASAGADAGESAVKVAGWVLAGYLSVGVPVVVYAAGGEVHVDLPTALYVPLFAAAAVGCGAWAGSGRSARAGRALPGRYRPYLAEAFCALRAAGIGLGVLVGGGALLGGASLAWHAGSSGRMFAQLSGPFAGQLAVLLIAVALVPNLAVWGACYGLGVGFSVGAGSAVSPAGAVGYGLLPRFPLLAALPEPGQGGWPGRAALALPVLAVCALGWRVGWAGRAPVRTARIAAEAAVLLGLGCAVLAAWSGGALGVDRLADLGPTGCLAGAAACGWALALGLPLALVLRFHLAHPLPSWATVRARLTFRRTGRAGARKSAGAPARPGGPGTQRGGPAARLARRWSALVPSGRAGSAVPAADPPAPVAAKAANRGSVETADPLAAPTITGPTIIGDTITVTGTTDGPDTLHPLPPLTDLLPWPVPPPGPIPPPSAPEEEPPPPPPVRN